MSRNNMIHVLLDKFIHNKTNFLWKSLIWFLKICVRGHHLSDFGHKIVPIFSLEDALTKRAYLVSFEDTFEDKLKKLLKSVKT